MRPVARILAGVFGGVASVLVGWFGGLWLAPLPLAAALLATEFWFWQRGDRVQVLALDGTTLRLNDPLATAPLTIDLKTITVASMFQRPDPSGQVEVVVCLGDDEDVQFAFRVFQDHPVTGHPDVVDATAMDVLFGGIAGLYRALAPADRRPRQTFIDPDGRLVAGVRAAVPAAAWSRTGLRLWPGMEPEIDLFGYFRAVHSEWLILEGHTWRRDGASGEIGGWLLASSEREAVLFQGLDRQQVQRLPLTLVNLGSNTTVAIPSPAEPNAGELTVLSSDLLHTHAPEGAALLWHLLTHTPRDRWPPILRQMIQERRPILADLDARLPG